MASLNVNKIFYNAKNISIKEQKEEGNNWSASFSKLEIVKKLKTLVHLKTQIGWNLNLFYFIFFTFCVRDYNEFAHFSIYFIKIFLGFVWN